MKQDMYEKAFLEGFNELFKLIDVEKARELLDSMDSIEKEVLSAFGSRPFITDYVIPLIHKTLAALKGMAAYETILGITYYYDFNTPALDGMIVVDGYRDGFARVKMMLGDIGDDMHEVYVLCSSQASNLSFLEKYISIFNRVLDALAIDLEEK